MTNNDLAAANRELVQRGLAEFAAGNIEVLRTLLHDDFIEHSPGNPSGKDAFIDFIAAAPVASAELEVARIIADDQYVVVHYRMKSQTSARDDAVVDIWRVVAGKLVEHWDVVQPVPEPAAVPHGMF